MSRGCIHSPPLTDDNDDDDDDATANKQDEYEYRQNICSQEIAVHDLLVRLGPKHFHTYMSSKVMSNGRDANHSSNTIYTFKSGDCDGILFGQHFHTHRSPKEFIHLFVYSFMHLCDGIEMLLNENMVHGNLNLFENILVRNDMPILSDFSLTLDALLSMPYSYENNNGIIPLELHLIRYIAQHRLQSVSEQNVEDIVYDVYSCCELFDPVQAAEEALAGQAYLMRFVNMSKFDIKKEVLRASRTWDVYMLCANYWKILNEFKGSCSPVFIPHLKLCEKLFMKYTHVNPELRLMGASGCGSALTCKELMKKIFSVYR